MHQSEKKGRAGREEGGTVAPLREIEAGWGSQGTRQKKQEERKMPVTSMDIDDHSEESRF